MFVGCSSQSRSQIKLVLASAVNQRFSMVVSSVSAEFQLSLKRKGRKKKKSGSLGTRSKLCDCGPMEGCFTNVVGKEKQGASVTEAQRGPAAGPDGSDGSVTCGSCRCLPVPTSTTGARGMGTPEGRRPTHIYKPGCCEGEATWCKCHAGVPALGSRSRRSPWGPSVPVSMGLLPPRLPCLAQPLRAEGPFLHVRTKGKTMLVSQKSTM